MDVFHYVADVLKDVDLFDSDHQANKSNEGSIYNDYDRCPLALLHGNSDDLFCYSQTSNLDKQDDEVYEEESIQEAVDHAIMAEDKAEGVHYDHLQWETELFDNYSDITSAAYLAKVHQLATDDHVWHDLNFTKETIRMFERRLRTQWEDADSVYDAWVLRKGYTRPLFDYNTFHVRYPDFASQPSQIALDKKGTG